MEEIAEKEQPQGSSGEFVGWGKSERVDDELANQNQAAFA